jgi:hypothetical protein
MEIEIRSWKQHICIFLADKDKSEMGRPCFITMAKLPDIQQWIIVMTLERQRETSDRNLLFRGFVKDIVFDQGECRLAQSSL